MRPGLMRRTVLDQSDGAQDFSNGCSGRPAVGAAQEIARRHGIATERARVLHDVNNLVVHLAPSPVVAKICRAPPLETTVSAGWPPSLKSRATLYAPALLWLTQPKSCRRAGTSRAATR